MQIIIALVIAFTALASCDQAETDNGAQGLLTDDEAINLINENIIAGEAEKYKDEEFASIIFNSIDKKCVLNHLKKHNAVDQILQGLKDENSTRLQDIQHEDSSRLLVLLLSGICFKNFDTFLDYTFENFMTLNILYRNFIDEPEFKEYADDFRCFTAYAIEHKIFDTQTYKLNTVVNESEACEIKKENVRINIDRRFTNDFFKSFNIKNKECFQKVFTRVENFILHSVLLIQIELNNEQRVLEKSNFIKDIHSIAEDLSVCVISA